MKVTTKAAVLGYCGIDLQENTHGETYHNNVEGNKLVNFTAIEFCHRCYPVKRHVYRTPLGNWKVLVALFWKIAILKILLIYGEHVVSHAFAFL